MLFWGCEYADHSDSRANLSYDQKKSIKKIVDIIPDRDFVQTIDCSRESISFSDMAQPGKTSVFILSAHWCKPCVILKKQLETAFLEGAIDPAYVDVYYCLLSEKGQNFDQMTKNPSYSNFALVDRLTGVFPTVLLLGPTTNWYAVIDGGKYNDIMDRIDVLVERTKNDFRLEHLSMNTPAFNGRQSNSQYLTTENQRLHAEVLQLKKELRQLSSSRPSPSPASSRSSQFPTNPAYSQQPSISNSVELNTVECGLHDGGKVLRIALKNDHALSPEVQNALIYSFSAHQQNRSQIVIRNTNTLGGNIIFNPVIGNTSQNRCGISLVQDYAQGDLTIDFNQSVELQHMKMKASEKGIYLEVFTMM